ncbi:DUF202 domain-containing protein [Paractinoplanes lichenicola]|uniref:DUF202 domain-containing protein n=1 Tax=Paractinoplanes lichenicola TaxID=2802976 RepID=A0ABS1VYB6_9ACTN|nr:DUF202 domain-containing protein [Actinoplanes lichenicola]MBL7259477.1 hypothetical protein [Actinoplanes lichenicola]
MNADGGLQVERTILAWRRTAASVVVAAVVGARFLLPHLGGWSFLAAITASLAVLVIAAAALRRRVPPSDFPVAPSAAPQPARWLAAVALATAIGGLGVALAVFAAG